MHVRLMWKSYTRVDSWRKEVRFSERLERLTDIVFDGVLIDYHWFKEEKDCFVRGPLFLHVQLDVQWVAQLDVPLDVHSDIHLDAHYPPPYPDDWLSVTWVTEDFYERIFGKSYELWNSLIYLDTYPGTYPYPDTLVDTIVQILLYRYCR